MKKVNHFNQFIKRYDDLMNALKKYSNTDQGFWPFNFEHDIAPGNLQVFDEDRRFYLTMTGGKNPHRCVFLFQTYPTHQRGSSSEVINQFLTQSQRFYSVHSDGDGYEFGIYRRDWRLPTDTIWSLQFLKPHFAVRKDGVILVAAKTKAELKRWYESLYKTEGELVEPGEKLGWINAEHSVPSSKMSSWVEVTDWDGLEYEAVYYPHLKAFGPNGIGFNNKTVFPSHVVKYWKPLHGKPKEQEIQQVKLKIRDEAGVAAFAGKLRDLKSDDMLYNHFGENIYEIIRIEEGFRLTVYKSFLHKLEASYDITKMELSGLVELFARLYFRHMNTQLISFDDYCNLDLVYRAANTETLKAWNDCLKTRTNLELSQ